MELNLGEIYYLKNKENNKGYIGQACCYTGRNNTKWGSKNRWKSHLREAYSSKKKDRCLALNNAIRKYGDENFELIILGKFDLNELDNQERKFIKKYNTLVPNGYNLNEGGRGGKDSEETRKRKSKAILLRGVNPPESIEKQRLSSIGNRRKAKKRKYKEDEKLPKYILAKRQNGKIISYSINKYPIGITEKKYLSYNFKTLEKALNKLNELKKEYAYIDEEIKKKNEKIKKQNIQNKLKNKKFKKLPEYIDRIFTENGKIKGYKVIYNNEIKEFIGKTNICNLKNAEKYLKLLQIEEKNNKFIIPSKLPPHVYIIKNKDKKIIGFSMTKPYYKKIIHPLLTLEQKYNQILMALDSRTEKVMPTSENQ